MSASLDSARLRPALGPTLLLPRLRVLVVDNEKDVVDSQALLLELLGQTVARAYGGREAIQRALEAWPNLVLLDLEMPDMSGIEVAMELRRYAPLEDARILAHTGSVSELSPRLRKAGFDGVLPKPAALPELVKVLQGAVRSATWL